MNAKKMVVVMLAKTRAVLGAVSRRAGGKPSAAEVIGDFLVARLKDEDAALMVPVADLDAKEVEYRDEVFRTPRAYVVDNSDAVVVAQNRVNGTAISTVAGLQVQFTLSTSTVPADKDVLLIVDAGSTSEPFRFASKTVLNKQPLIAVSGVPAGARLVLASVDGYNAKLEMLTFP